jgi:hypothetical protein
MKRKPTRKHWYRTYIGECVLCGRDEGYRERVYGKRPKSASKRYRQLPTSACEHHFM